MKNEFFCLINNKTHGQPNKEKKLFNICISMCKHVFPAYLRRPVRCPPHPLPPPPPPHSSSCCSTSASSREPLWKFSQKNVILVDFFFFWKQVCKIMMLFQKELITISLSIEKKENKIIYYWSDLSTIKSESWSESQCQRKKH